MKLLRNPARQLVKAMLVFGFTSAIGVAPLFAQGTFDTLADLANGGTLSIDDKTFSGVDFLTWTGSISLVSGGFASADLLLNYIVTANPGTISMIDQRYSGNVQDGSLLINETATSAGAPTAHSQLSVNDTSDPNTYPSGPFDVGESDLLSVNPPQSTLYVTKDLSLVVLSAGGSVNIDLVEQSFHQVPEPSAILLGSLGGGLLVFLRSRRQARRN
jgi:hypothetical protein